MNCDDGTAKICARVNEVLKILPTPTSVVTPEKIFGRRNLLSVEIRSTCSQMIEYYKSILILVGQELYRPAASLSRSIQEACFRLEYLCCNENELRDWMEWQMSQDYHFIKDFLQYETTVTDSNRRNFEEQMKELVTAMGYPPKKRGFPWRSTGEILSGISDNMPDGYDKRLKRLLYEYPSRFVHLRAGGDPTPDYVVGGARSSLLLAITLAMKLCRDEQLVPTDFSRETDEIVTMCNKLRGIDVMDSEL